MMQYVIQNYLVAYATSFVTILTFLLTVIAPAVHLALSTWKKLGICIIASILLSIPTATISGNLYNRDNRQTAIEKLTELHNELITKKGETTEYWSSSGVGSNYPTEVPWPLLLSQEELQSWIVKFKHLEKTSNRYFTPTISGYLNEILQLIDASHVGTFTVKCSSSGNSTVSFNPTPPLIEAICSDGKNGEIIQKHSFTHKQFNLLVSFIELLEDKMNEECSLGFHPPIRKTRFSLTFNLPFSDTKAWIMLEDAARDEAARDKSSYYSNMVEGLALFITGREDRGAKSLSSTIDAIENGAIVRPIKDDLVLVACGLMYKYSTFPSPENRDHGPPGSASRYRNLGHTLGGEEFDRIISGLEKSDYGDPDLAWHYKTDRTSPKNLEVNLGGTSPVGKAIIW